MEQLTKAKQTAKILNELAAFVAFKMGAGGEENFGQFLETIGLRDKSPQRIDSRHAEDDTAALASMGIEVKKVKR